MRIITVNIPENYLIAIERLCGKMESDIYPSRSEFARQAIKNQLLRDFALQKVLDNPGIIETKTSFRKKSYKIIKKIPVEEESIKMPTTKLTELRKQYPEIADYKFIGESNE